jgi:hypothetical protein
MSAVSHGLSFLCVEGIFCFDVDGVDMQRMMEEVEGAYGGGRLECRFYAAAPRLTGKAARGNAKDTEESFPGG